MESCRKRCNARRADVPEQLDNGKTNLPGKINEAEEETDGDTEAIINEKVVERKPLAAVAEWGMEQADPPSSITPDEMTPRKERRDTEIRTYTKAEDQSTVQDAEKNNTDIRSVFLLKKTQPRPNVFCRPSSFQFNNSYYQTFQDKSRSSRSMEEESETIIETKRHEHVQRAEHGITTKDEDILDSNRTRGNMERKLCEGPSTKNLLKNNIKTKRHGSIHEAKEEFSRILQAVGEELSTKLLAAAAKWDTEQTDPASSIHPDEMTPRKEELDPAEKGSMMVSEGGGPLTGGVMQEQGTGLNTREKPRNLDPDEKLSVMVSEGDVPPTGGVTQEQEEGLPTRQKSPNLDPDEKVSVMVSEEDVLPTGGATQEQEEGLTTRQKSRNLDPAEKVSVMVSEGGGPLTGGVTQEQGTGLNTREKPRNVDPAEKVSVMVSEEDGPPPGGVTQEQEGLTTRQKFRNVVEACIRAYSDQSGGSFHEPLASVHPVKLHDGLKGLRSSSMASVQKGPPEKASFHLSQVSEGDSLPRGGATHCSGTLGTEIAKREPSKDPSEKVSFVASEGDILPTGGVTPRSGLSETAINSSTRHFEGGKSLNPKRLPCNGVEACIRAYSDRSGGSFHEPLGVHPVKIKGGLEGWVTTAKRSIQKSSTAKGNRSSRVWDGQGKSPGESGSLSRKLCATETLTCRSSCILEGQREYPRDSETDRYKDWLPINKRRHTRPIPPGIWVVLPLVMALTAMTSLGASIQERALPAPMMSLTTSQNKSQDGHLLTINCTVSHDDFLYLEVRELGGQLMYVEDRVITEESGLKNQYKDRVTDINKLNQTPGFTLSLTARIPSSWLPFDVECTAIYGRDSVWAVTHVTEQVTTAAPIEDEVTTHSMDDDIIRDNQTTIIMNLIIMSVSMVMVGGTVCSIALLLHRHHGKYKPEGRDSRPTSKDGAGSRDECIPLPCTDKNEEKLTTPENGFPGQLLSCL